MTWQIYGMEETTFASQLRVKKSNPQSCKPKIVPSNKTAFHIAALYRLLTASVPLARCEVKIHLTFLVLLLVEAKKKFTPDNHYWAALSFFVAVDIFRQARELNSSVHMIYLFLWFNFRPLFIFTFLKTTNAHAKVYFSRILAPNHCKWILRTRRKIIKIQNWNNWLACFCHNYLSNNDNKKTHFAIQTIMMTTMIQRSRKSH